MQPGCKIAEAAASSATYGMTSAVLLYKDGFLRKGGRDEPIWPLSRRPSSVTQMAIRS